MRGQLPSATPDCRRVHRRMRDPLKTDLAGGGAIGRAWVDPGADNVDLRNVMYLTKADKQDSLSRWLLPEELRLHFALKLVDLRRLQHPDAGAFVAQGVTHACRCGNPLATNLDPIIKKQIVF